MNNYLIHINKKEKTETLTHLEAAIHALSCYEHEVPNEKILAVLEAIRLAICHKDKIIVPIDVPEETHDIIRKTYLESNTDFHLPEDALFNLRTLELENGNRIFAVFTDIEKAMMVDATSTITKDLENFLEKTLFHPNIEGILINPWSESFYLSKKNIRAIFHANLPIPKKNLCTFQTIHLSQKETVSIEKTTDEKILRNCYWNALEEARKQNIYRVIFPSVSIDNCGCSIEKSTKIALKTVSDWININPNCGMNILFACDSDKTTDLYRSIWNRHKECWNERPIIRENGGQLEAALQFAMDAHKGATRKGSNKPYILHPIETLQILSSMDADLNLMIAGLLHDTLEDTDTTLLDIYDRFGMDVAALVNGHTEDKRNIWYMRKLITTVALPHEDLRAKMLTIADKVANMRSMFTDYKQIGEKLWERFNAPKEYQAWYYSNLNDGLAELQNYSETADVYWEMTGLYKDLFVTYLIDDDQGILYQLSKNGEHYALKKEYPEWTKLLETPSKTVRQIGRKEAERIEENWYESLLTKVEPVSFES